MTPELKEALVPMPFDGFTQEMYAQKMIDEYKQARVNPNRVYAQSFNINDILYWIANEPEFGNQAVSLEDLNTPRRCCCRDCKNTWFSCERCTNYRATDLDFSKA